MTKSANRPSKSRKIYKKNLRNIKGSKHDRIIEYALVAVALIVVLIGAIF